MNKEEFIDITENVAETVKETVVETATEVSETVQESVEQVKEAAQEATQQVKETAQQATKEDVLPKVEVYVNQQLKANPSLAATLLQIGGVGDIIVSVFQFIFGFLLLVASSVIGSLITSFFGLGGAYNALADADATSLAILSLISSFGSAFFVGLAIIILIIAALNLWFGIRAVRDRHVKGKAGFLFVAGIIQTVMSVLSLIMSSHVGIVRLGMVALSICYLAGAYLKRKAESQG